MDSSEKLYFKIPANREGDFEWVVQYLSFRWPEKWDLKLDGEFELGRGHIISTQDEEMAVTFREWGLSHITSCNRTFS